MIKNALSKLKMGGNLLELITVIFKKPKADNQVNGERLNGIRMIRKKTRMTTLLNIVLEVLARTIRKESEIKSIRLEKKKENCLLEYGILYIKNPKKSAKKLLEYNKS